MTTPVDDLQPIPPQPEISEGNKVFHEKSYNLYVWMRTKLAPAIEYLVSLIVNFVAGAYNATSTTSMVLGTGSKTITVQAGRSYVPGNPIRVAYTTDPNYYADGIVTAYNSTTGVLTFDSKIAPLTGTYANWTVSIVPNSSGLAILGINKFTGLQSFANAVTVASAATLDLTTANSNNIVISGNAIISAITMPEGAWILAVCESTPSFVQGASLAIRTGMNGTAKAGDILLLTRAGSVTRILPLFTVRTTVNLTGSRVFGTIYTNTDLFERNVDANTVSVGVNTIFQVRRTSGDSWLFPFTGSAPSGYVQQVSGKVPPGWQYQVVNGTTNYWAES